MAQRRMISVDGNEAVTSIAHRTNEVCVIYPITPSSSMGEVADEWSAQGRTNIWGVVPDITEMQSEAGAIGACHGSLQAGALTTTFTASQGLLLMIPNMFKIAGELSPFCMHVSARTVATHALSIFGDQSDVMAVRQTGFSLLASGSVQEAHDMALIGQAATLESRIPVLHFFDGFRTSHEVNKVEELTDADVAHMLPEELIEAHRERALNPDAPVLRGSSQNPDTFFQMQEARNSFYDRCPDVTQSIMDKFAALTGRKYRLFDYVGHPQAERVMIMMGSGAEVAHETVERLAAEGEKVGLVKVRLFRPFSTQALMQALPKTTRSVAVMDRTKEFGAVGEPLFCDVLAGLAEASALGELPLTAGMPRVIGGRYGLSSKNFTPAMAKAVFDELTRDKPKPRFTVGINDDVTGLSLAWDPTFRTEAENVHRAMFWGTGGDGTVGANKNTIKIISENTDNFAQGYFVYDSKKSGGYTTSHVRFAPQPIRSSYLVDDAEFIACHTFVYVDKYDMLEQLSEGGTFLLNSPYGADEVWDHLPREMQQQLIDKNANFYVIDAQKVAAEAGMGKRVNTVLQTCYFALSDVLPRDEAIAQIKEAIRKTYALKGDEVVQKNYAAVDHAVNNLHKVALPAQPTTDRARPPMVPEHAPDLVKKVTSLMLADKGDLLPVSAFPPDGTWPTGTAQYEKRNLSDTIPEWTPEYCIQCNKCAMVCPHAAIRVKTFEPALLDDAPQGFQAMPYKAKEFGDAQYTVQVAPEDCTGCDLCVNVCPPDKKTGLKPLEMVDQRPILEREKANWDFFLDIPEVDRTKLKPNVKLSQFAKPLIEFSGACLGCGETPYLKAATQLYGDRMMIANSTGCSSIFGGNLPTTPYTVDEHGRGPAWSNSLFEDTAEFGLGFRLAIDQRAGQAKALMKELSGQIGDELIGEILTHEKDRDEAGVQEQRKRVEALREKLARVDDRKARLLEGVANDLVHRSVWIMGGDGWAYDIGYGGLDHVLSTDANVNILVMDTEVYSNTGGQQSKATPLASAAKFAVAGKTMPKKDLGLMAIAYGTAYVASVAFGAKDAQTMKVLEEAESYPGPSMIIAYSHCIAHGYSMADGLDQQKRAVDTGYWPLYRYDPRKLAAGEAPLTLDSKEPAQALEEYVKNETRFRSVERQNPELYKELMANLEQDIHRRYQVYHQLSGFKLDLNRKKGENEAAE